MCMDDEHKLVIVVNPTIVREPKRADPTEPMKETTNSARPGNFRAMTVEG